MEWREREREMKVRRDLKMNSTPLLRTHACLSSSLLLSSTLHLLSSANVFTLVFPRPPCHSRSPSLFPLCQSPPDRKVNRTVKRAVAALWKELGTKLQGKTWHFLFPRVKTGKIGSVRRLLEGSPRMMNIAVVICQSLFRSWANPWGCTWDC